MSEQEVINDLDLDEPAVQSKTALVCPTCGKVAKTSAGLAGHMRLMHQKPTKQDGYAKYSAEALDKQQEALYEALIPIMKSIKTLSERVLALQQYQESTKDHVDEALSRALGKIGNSFENFSELNKKLAIVGKLIESVGNGVIMTSSAQWCLDDIKGLKALGVECTPFTLEHSKK